MLSDKQIIEFQRLYKNYFGKEISRQEACERGEKLVRLIELVCKQKIINNKKYEINRKKI